MRHSHFLITLLLAIPGFSRAQKQLPLFSPGQDKAEVDWLAQPKADKKTKARLCTTQEGFLVFTNGLASRTFTLSPNVASVALDETTGNTSFLRSIRPEAEITLNGYTFPIGGLKGQPVHNHLQREWIQTLTSDPTSFQSTGYRLESTKERFPWQKNVKWMPKDMPWPAPGKELIFTYRLTDEAINQLADKGNQDEQRTTLLAENFTQPDKNWIINVSKSHPRNSFVNEGKIGEIMALSNTAVYAERDWNDKAKVALLQVTKGTDSSASWGPGMAVTLGNRTVKLNVRSAEGKVGFFDGRNERVLFPTGKAQSVILRLEWAAGGKLLAAASLDGGETWQEAGVVKLEENERPLKVRIGKMDSKGGGNDFGEKGTMGRCRLESFRLLGDLSTAATNSAKSQLAYLKNVEVEVHYELYDHMPVFSKWVTLSNHSNQSVTVNAFKSEILAAHEPESAVDERHRWLYPNITIDTDYNFGGMSEEYIYSSSVAWKPDPLYTTQVNYARQTPCLLEVAPKIGPEQEVKPGGTFESFRVWELLNDSWDRERKSLAYRRMMRSIAPWVTENPVLMHVRSSDDASVKKAIDQCAEVGFEMVIMTFWSGFNAEDDSPANLGRMKKLADYARSKGIALGGYSLLASRHIDKDNDVLMPEGKSPRFGNSPCVESNWGQEYMRKLYNLYETTGLNVFEHDGSYPGDICCSTKHPGHKELKDSQWKQFRTIAGFYRWCRGKGIYLNVPDLYFLNGSNKVGMGYREANWSLPREWQEIVERQNIYDGTWSKTPSMGWMFVPLVEYQGGGKAATIEPLKEHLPHYGQRMANLFGAGVQACYRGPQLYDSPETKALVSKWVMFYKRHRDVLDGDIIHLRRPDGRDYDAILHVNPLGKEKGLLMVYNPLDKPIHRQLKVNLYYTGLTDSARIAEQDGKAKKVKLDRDYNVRIDMEIPAKSQTWFVIQ